MMVKRACPKYPRRYSYTDWIAMVGRSTGSGGLAISIESTFNAVQYAGIAIACLLVSINYKVVSSQRYHGG